ncbi:PulJ/GspJ family protein [Hymenobacter lucidus]|uniref:Prepilin-type N-terminal cleavage/methylation domain-containing protein n=1 Tax=Hymenobacter lucidus TaxID=2880930 RepID=A0ABS8AZE8_9BACT|nr:prepilin-type N-terminal cleavage/methylation domain-containing protein [Hymenobacter lucidus]MCB2411143.1 prepilin-type N-terminal cleavage/methylation domain-containing protein [Hymenobacter lucidus]
MLTRTLRLRSFTLVELMLALVLSALIFGMAYAGLRIVQQQQQLFQQKAQILGQVSTLQTVLIRDFDRASSITAVDNRVQCTQQARMVEYHWLDSVVTRQQGEVTDTFQLPLLSVDYYFQAQPQQAGLIDEVALAVVVLKDTFHLQAATTYSAGQLLLRTSHK